VGHGKREANTNTYTFIKCIARSLDIEVQLTFKEGPLPPSSSCPFSGNLMLTNGKKRELFAGLGLRSKGKTVTLKGEPLT
jgi:hypothetical protein